LKRLGVVAALEAEARAFRSSAQRHRSPNDRSSDDRSPGTVFSVLNDGSLLAVSGVGFGAATDAARALAAAPVSALMTFGVAGGLDPALKAGTVVLPTQVISSDGARFATCRSWQARLAAAVGTPYMAVGGILLSSPMAIETPADKAIAFRDSGAVAVDMESVAVAEIAAAHQLPFVALRVIVDTASDALPPSVIAASRAGRVKIGRLLAGLLTAPGEIATVIGLSLRYRAAMRSLRAVAADGACAPHDSDTHLT
jgi:adenosylhomocysteine nucleosidase